MTHTSSIIQALQARPTKAAGLGRGSGDSGDSGRGTRSRLAGQGQRQRQAAARQKPNETRAIGGRERARLACESGPGGERVEKSNSKPSGADRKWSQAHRTNSASIARPLGKLGNNEKIQFCQCWASERGCIANRPPGSSEAATGGSTPHCGSLRGSRRGAAQSKPS
ncbi:hypothetical protein L1887_62122 [Cichorium endivia]|nr:hypothetical protein L1887_62122 [Cichorium endivia]